MSAWTSEKQDAVNKQISVELGAALGYLALAAQFQRPETHVEKLVKMFEHEAEQEIVHSKKLVREQVVRGGTPVVALESAEPYWLIKSQLMPLVGEGKLADAVASAFNIVLDMELEVWIQLHALHKFSVDDPQLADFIEGELLSEQAANVYDARKKVLSLQHAATGGDSAVLLWLEDLP